MVKVKVTTSSFGKIDAKPIHLLKEAGFDVELNPYKRKLSVDESVSFLKDSQIVLAGTELYSKDVIEQLPFLEVISRCGAGTDGIDKEALESRSIKLYSTPEVHITAVAELTLAGLLSITRRIAELNHSMKSNEWNKVIGTNLSGKTVGLIGFGKVAQLFTKLLSGFNCRVIFYDPYVKELEPTNCESHTKEYLFENSDIISLHLPFNEETRNFINKQELRQMKDEVILLNTARGGIVDEVALYDFLVKNSRATAYLDVYEKEPYQGELTKLKNAVLTPHVGTFTKETRVAMEVEAAQNIINHYG